MARFHSILLNTPSVLAIIGQECTNASEGQGLKALELANRDYPSTPIPFSTYPENGPCHFRTVSLVFS